MDALLISTDLMAISKVNAAASQAGVEVPSASPGLALDQVQVAKPKEIYLDLTAPVSDIKALVIELRCQSSGAKIYAFGPHVHEAKLAAAEEAGCDQVMPRGAFHKQLDAILANLK